MTIYIKVAIPGAEFPAIFQTIIFGSRLPFTLGFLEQYQYLHESMPARCSDERQRVSVELGQKNATSAWTGAFGGSAANTDGRISGQYFLHSSSGAST